MISLLNRRVFQWPRPRAADPRLKAATACRPRRRRGLSLLEVLLALAILGGSLAAIGELMRIGARSAEASRDQTTAQILGESIMSQIGAGLIPPEAVTSAQVDDPLFQLEWSYTIVIEPVDQAGLNAVWVTVQQSPEIAARPVTYTLVRWMIDPEVLAQLAEAEL